MAEIDEMKRGVGCWRNFGLPPSTIFKAAEEWRSIVKGVSKPWLCWHVSLPWTRLQVNLVRHFGWTPVVGFDPDCGENVAPEIPDALVIDFNKQFGFKKLWPHFPLEFAFLWSERLAFWHADLLVRLPLLAELVDLFGKIPDGHMAACPGNGRGLRDLFRYRNHRMWELIGVTTAGASEDQYRNGCGWWRNFALHPNCPPNEYKDRSRYYYDSGVGIMYWHRKCGGVVHRLPTKRINEGHCTSINNRDYIKLKDASGRTPLGKQMDLNYHLPTEAKRMGLEDFL